MLLRGTGCVLHRDPANQIFHGIRVLEQDLIKRAIHGGAVLKAANRDQVFEVNDSFDQDLTIVHEEGVSGEKSLGAAHNRFVEIVRHVHDLNLDRTVARALQQETWRTIFAAEIACARCNLRCELFGDNKDVFGGHCEVGMVSKGVHGAKFRLSKQFRAAIWLYFGQTNKLLSVYVTYHRF